MSKYRKFIGAAVAAFASAVVAVGADGVTSVEFVNALVAALGAVIVLLAATEVYWKALAGAVSAALVVLATALSDGVSGAEWYQITFAGVAFAVAALVPNAE